MNIDPDRGLVVRLPNPLGDFCSAEPALASIYAAFAARGAQAQLGLAAPLARLELLAGRFPGARRIALPGSVAEGPRSYARDGAGGREPVGAALLLPGSFRSALAAFRARVPRRLGAATDGRRLLLTDALVPSAERGARSRGRAARRALGRRLPEPPERAYADLAGLLGVGVVERSPRLAPSAALAERVDARLAALPELAAGRPFVLVNAGGSAHAAKGLQPAEAEPLLAALARELPGHGFLLAAAPGEQATAEGLAERLERRLPGRVALGFAERPASAPEFLALARRASLGFSTDTGPLHLMRAAGLPRVCLIGPTDARHSAAWVAGSELRLRLELPCAPCHRSRCPLEGPAERACLRGFDAAEVASRAVALLASAPGAPRP